MGVREHSPSPAPPGTPDGSSRPGPGSPPAHCPPQASLLSGVTPGLPTSLAPHSGATGFPAGLDGVASSRGTHRRLWGLGVGGTFSPGTRIFLSKQRLWDVCVGSLASAWGACSLGVSLAWSSVNCSHGLGFRNLETLPSAVRGPLEQGTECLWLATSWPHLPATWQTRGCPDWTSRSFSPPHISRKAGQSCSFPWIQGRSHPPPTSRPISKPSSPGCPGFFQLRPQTPPVSLRREPSSGTPRPHLLGPVLTTAASETPKGLRPQAPLLLRAPQRSPPRLSCARPPLWGRHTPVVCSATGARPP